MFGDIIQELLSLKGLSQKQFAEILAIPYTTLNGYIKNKREPDFKTLIQISDVLNVSIDFLLSHISTDKPHNSNELILLQWYRELTTEQKELITVQIQTMRKQNLNK